MDENESIIEKLKKMIEESEMQEKKKLQEENAQTGEIGETEAVQPEAEEITEEKTDEQAEENVSEYKETAQEEEKTVKEKKKRTVLPVIITAVCTLFICVIAVAVIALVPSPKKSLLAKYISKYADTKVIYYGEKENPTIGGTEIPSGSNVEIKVETNSIASAVYAKCAQSVVGIRITQTTGKFWEKETMTICEGSGVIYTSDGYIITNHHIIEEALDKSGKQDSAYSIQVFLDSSLLEYYEAKIIGYDETSDLALIKIEKTGLLPIEIADADEIEVGQNAVAIGCPGGLEFMDSVTTGVISGISRNLNNEDAVAYDLIQTDTTINPGNSGGALLNEEGKLIGICVLKIVASGYENMGFAVSSETVQTIIPQLMETGKVTRTKLGVEIYTVYNKNIADEYGYPLGCYVNSVTSGGCAEKAGIRAEDIITEIEGIQINDFYQMRKILLSFKPGESVKITVFRISSKTYETFTVILDEA